MSRGRAVRLTACVAVLVALGWRVGLGPFVDAARTLDARTLLLGLALGVPTTLCCAWRWTLVSEAYGVTLPLRQAVTSYYRSQLVNVALPGGVAGDVHRGYLHGLRAVVWERACGQVVLVAIAGVVLTRLPVLAVVAVVALAGAVVLAVRKGVPLRVATGVLLASVGALAGPVATFVVAARSAGVTVPTAMLAVLALPALLAMALPLSIAGWGPREGVAAWSFSVAGLDAGAGVTTAVVYGVMTLVAVLPGVVVLLARPGRRRRQEVVARA